jgi:hypothetical protein
VVHLFRSTRVVVASTCAVAVAAGAGLSPASAGEPRAGGSAGPAAKPDLLPGEGFHWKRAVERRRVARQRAIRQARGRRRARVAVPAALQSIAQCESGANPKRVSGDGTYRGKYQFSRETWAAMGGKGDPARAPEAEQDKRAIALYNSSGPGQWPVCSQ